MTNSSKLPVCTNKNAWKHLGNIAKYCGKEFFLFCLYLVTAIGFFFVSSPFLSHEVLGQEKKNRKIAANEVQAARQASQMSQEQEVQDALKNIPWNSLGSDAKGKIRNVISAHSIFRRLPQQKIYSDPEMYHFLVEHPDIVVSFWQKLGVSQILLREQKDNRFWMKESTGTTAIAEVLYRTNDLCIVHGRGRYLGPLLAKAYDGEVVLILRSRFSRSVDNEPIVVCDLDAFVRIDNIGADLFAKLFATTLGKIADSNFEQTVAFVSHVSEAATINPDSVKNLSSKLTEVREEVRDDFGDVVQRVAIRAARRQGRTFPQYYALDSLPREETTSFIGYAVTQTSPLESTDPTYVPILVDQNAVEFSHEEFYHRTPTECLLTYKDTSTFNSDLVLDEASVFAPAPLLKSEIIQPLPMPVEHSQQESSVSTGVATETLKPMPKGRAVFGTPKIARQTEEKP